MRPSSKAAMAALLCGTVLGTTALAQAPLPHRPGLAAANGVTASSVKREVSDEASATAAATAVATTGTLVAKFTMKLVTPVPSGGEVLCGLNASVQDENTSTYTFANQIFESASTKAAVSGSTATCTVTIPYSWFLTYASTDTVQLTYMLYVLNGTATTQANEARSSSQYVPGAGAIRVPANGATTTYTISATL